DKAVQTISAAHVLTALWVLQTGRSVPGGPPFGSVSDGGVGQGAFNSDNLLNSPRPLYLVSVAAKEGKGRKDGLEVPMES
ncbi:hypothetical protein J6590_103178, partial [Homalodisca vitripennis]